MVVENGQIDTVSITRGWWRRGRRRCGRLQDSWNDIKGDAAADDDHRSSRFPRCMRVTGSGLHHRTNLSINQTKLFSFATLHFGLKQTQTRSIASNYQQMTGTLFESEFARRSLSIIVQFSRANKVPASLRDARSLSPLARTSHQHASDNSCCDSNSANNGNAHQAFSRDLVVDQLL